MEEILKFEQWRVGAESEAPRRTMADFAQDDQELLRQLARGNEVAFKTLYDRYQGPIYRFALHMKECHLSSDELCWLFSPLFLMAAMAGFHAQLFPAILVSKRLIVVRSTYLSRTLDVKPLNLFPGTRVRFGEICLLGLAVACQRLAMSAVTSYQTGQTVPESGVYRVIHAGHRLPHAVVICKDESFPRCAKCLDLVLFELIHGVECPFTYEPMHVYELHPVDGEQAASASLGSES